MIITHWIHHYLVCVYIYIFYCRSRYFRNSNKVIIKRGKSGGTIMLCAWTEEREGELKKMPGLWRRYVTSAVDFLFAKEKKKKLQKGFWVFGFLSSCRITIIVPVFTLAARGRLAQVSIPFWYYLELNLYRS